MQCCRHITEHNILLTVSLHYIQFQYNAVLCVTNLPWTQSSYTGAVPASQPIFMCWGEPCQPVSVHDTWIKVNMIGSHCGSGINSQLITPASKRQKNAYQDWLGLCWPACSSIHTTFWVGYVTILRCNQSIASVFQFFFLGTHFLKLDKYLWPNFHEA